MIKDTHQENRVRRIYSCCALVAIPCLFLLLAIYSFGFFYKGWFTNIPLYDVLENRLLIVGSLTLIFIPLYLLYCCSLLSSRNEKAVIFLFWPFLILDLSQHIRWLLYTLFILYAWENFHHHLLRTSLQFLSPLIPIFYFSTIGKKVIHDLDQLDIVGVHGTSVYFNKTDVTSLSQKKILSENEVNKAVIKLTLLFVLGVLPIIGLIIYAINVIDITFLSSAIHTPFKLIKIVVVGIKLISFLFIVVKGLTLYQRQHSTLEQIQTVLWGLSTLIFYTLFANIIVYIANVEPDTFGKNAIILFYVLSIYWGIINYYFQRLLNNTDIEDYFE